MYAIMATFSHTAKTRTIRVSTQSHESLRRWAAQHGCSLVAAVDQLVEEAERERFWEEMDAYHATLRENPQALAEYQAESEALEGPVADGLEQWPWEEA
jgi:hypothetical protein